MRSWCSMISMVVIAIVAGLAWSATAMAQQKLTAADAAQDDYFGYSVSVSGDYAIVGAHGNDDAGSLSGSAYIFNWDGTSWTEQQKITASDANGSDEFGWKVSIAGDYAIIGASRDDDGGSVVF